MQVLSFLFKSEIANFSRLIAFQNNSILDFFSSLIKKEAFKRESYFGNSIVQSLLLLLKDIVFFAASHVL